MLTSAHADSYREKAAELRLLANHLLMPGARKDVEAIAVLYERLADTLDALEIKRRRKISY
jgi:3-dehydroquinate dehydratase